MVTAYSRESAVSHVIDRLEDAIRGLDENDEDGSYASLNDARHAITTAIGHIERAMQEISAEANEYAETITCPDCWGVDDE